MSIPAGWSVAPLQELCEFHNGLWKGKKGPFVTARVIRNTNFTADGRIDLSDVAVLDVEQRQLAKRELQKNDIIIEKSGGGPKQPVGRVVLFELDDDGYSFSNFTSVIRVKQRARIDPVYLHRVLNWWYVSGVTEFLQKRSTGIRNLDFNAYKALEVPFPQIAEQRRIVAFLDQAFIALDRARACVELNIKEATELYETYVHSMLPYEPQVDDPKERQTVKDVSTIRAGSGFPKKHQGQKSGQHPFYKVSDMNREGNEWRLRTANNYIDEATRKRLGAFVFPINSIVFPKVGGAILTNKKRVIESAGCVDNNIMGLIPDPEKILPEYLQEWVLSMNLYELSNKANPPSITQATVARWPLHVPSFPDQVRAVEGIRAMRALREKLIEAYWQRISDIAALRQSLLRRVFSGQLTM